MAWLKTVWDGIVWLFNRTSRGEVAPLMALYEKTMSELVGHKEKCEKDLGDLRTICWNHEQTINELEVRLGMLEQTKTPARVTVDSKGLVVGWDDSARRMFHWTVSEMQGQSLLRLIPGPLRLKHQTSFREVTGGRALRPGPYELMARTKEGLEFPIALMLSTWADESGQQMFEAEIRHRTVRSDPANSGSGSSQSPLKKGSDPPGTLQGK